MKNEKTPDEKTETKTEEQIIIDYIAKRWRVRLIPNELRNLEQRHYNFITENKRSGEPWLRILRLGLGMTTEAMAEKLNTNRSGVLRYERNEISKTITIKSLQAWAHATDSEFVYGFVPKDQPTFSHLIARRCLPFLDDDLLRSLPLPTERKAQTMYARMLALLGHKNGWSKIWGHTSVLKNSNYCWFNSKRRSYFP